MALRIFNSRNADYFLALEIHTEAEGGLGLIDHINGIDALILESGTPHSDIHRWNPYRIRPGEFGYCQATVLRSVASLKPNLPIFVVDYPHRVTAIDFVPLPAVILAGLSLFVHGLWKLVQGGQTNYLYLVAEILVGAILSFQGLLLERVGNRRSGGHLTTSILALETCLFPTPRDGFRDAVAAVKIEDHLISALGSKRPRIGIMYGVAHAGLVPKLKYKFLRTVTVWLYRLVGYFGADREHLNAISEFRLVGGELRLSRTYSCKLF